ncbi:hypothetical protein [Lyngbya sp. CCY1209]|uniref:hypothetical protein n=1 Tax=Lyngbya sp. CCY1209 TaxID=2886103 RepID=UPI002D217C47|nr:hypothetical protein [Lyngbya sp. CCY1209]MEB3887417.1 hypothetical protein [Lyngbya sp. CCY1209]
MNCSIFRFFCLLSGVAIAAVIWGESPTNAQPTRRLRPGFFEEEQDVEMIGGFSNTFLIDALGGVADPLTTSKGVATTVDSLKNVEVQRGVLGDRNFSPSFLRGNFSEDGVTPRPSLPPSFDRTNVIIPGRIGR